ncbi:MAG TPA: TerC/Alx family metal homeostasis membrane protein [Chitinophagaceae bacterium]|jgi:tellurite resistance protein TerC|nr:TerC/Alx family metal homeostasis membrane protein [Chitinophagaceae bacterium]
MTPDQVTYLVFGIVLIVALVFDLGLLSKKSTDISIRKALYQTVFWVSLALGFFAFMWWTEGSQMALEYLSAYLMEWSLSIDNIFVFILIFTFFKIRADHYARALLIGILMAIVFRVIFITVGVALVERFYWILYIFGALLVYTGIKIFSAKEQHEFNPIDNPVYKLINRFFPIIHDDISGKFTVVRDGKRYYTNMFVVILMLATTDIVFALDSIPAVFAISQERIVIYTSNTFAVLGLRSLFFLLRGAVTKFAYLQQGIAIVLIFIGLKMLVEYFHVHVPIYVSLLMIIVCLGGSIAYSIQISKRRSNNEL